MSSPRDSRNSGVEAEIEELLDTAIKQGHIESDVPRSSSGVLREAQAKDQTVIRVNHRKRRSFTKKRTKRLFSEQVQKFREPSFWVEKMPIIHWARSYNASKIIGDLIAGLTMALTVIPQGIGYAPLAGLPLQYGLYASIFPGFIYAILGTTKEATVGPTAVNSLMSYNYAGSSVIHATTLAFCAGIFEMAAGLFKLGFLINFVSAPVISAFTSAVSIQIVTSQVKGLLGLQILDRGFVNTWIGVFTHARDIRPCDASLGFVCIGVLLFLRRIKDFHWCEGSDLESRRARIIYNVKWLVSIARSCLVIFISAVLAYLIVDVYKVKDIFILTGDVESGIPAFQAPWKFNANETTPGFVEVVNDLGVGIVMVALVSLLQHMAIAKFYCPPTRRVAASQEMFALGSCQVLGSCVGSIAVTASFGRSAVNSASGVNSPFGGIVTGTIILLACAFLTPHFAYIPTSALSAVIICSMILTIDVEILLPMWRAKKLDLVPYSLTFFLGLFISVEVGMIVGTLAHLAILVYSASKPKVSVQEGRVDNLPYTLVTPDRGLFFPSVDEIRCKLSEASALDAPQKSDEESVGGSQNEPPVPVIVDMSRVVEMDFTAAVALRILSRQMKKSGQPIYFCCVREEIEEILQGVDSALFLAYVNIQDAEQKIRGS